MYTWEANSRWTTHTPLLFLATALLYCSVLLLRSTAPLCCNLLLRSTALVYCSALVITLLLRSTAPLWSNLLFHSTARLYCCALLLRSTDPLYCFALLLRSNARSTASLDGVVFTNCTNCCKDSEWDLILCPDPPTSSVDGWIPTPNFPIGNHGSCCAEMYIWEANSRSAAHAPHRCSITGVSRCDGVACGGNGEGQHYEGVCDKDAPDFNPWRMGDHTLYGRHAGFIVDSTLPFTVVTQFVTNDGTDTNDLVDIGRSCVQNGNINQICNRSAHSAGPSGQASKQASRQTSKQASTQDRKPETARNNHLRSKTKTNQCRGVGRRVVTPLLI